MASRKYFIYLQVSIIYSNKASLQVSINLRAFVYRKEESNHTFIGVCIDVTITLLYKLSHFEMEGM